MRRLLAYIEVRFMFKGVSVIWKYFNGVRISEIDLTVKLLDGFNEFYALILCEAKNFTLFYIS